MRHKLSGKKVLIVKGSLLVPFAVETALTERGAKAVTVTNIISAFSLLEREVFDAAVIDKGLHNEAFDLCAELKSLGVPFVLANAPHELQRPAMQMSAACDLLAEIVGRLQACAQDQTQPGTFPARFPVVKGMASMGVIDPAPESRQRRSEKPHVSNSPGQAPWCLRANGPTGHRRQAS